MDRMMMEIEIVTGKELSKEQYEQLFKKLEIYLDDRQFLRRAAIAAMQGWMSNPDRGPVNYEICWNHAEALLAEEKRMMEKQPSAT
jgi:hypothetical protein